MEGEIFNIPETANRIYVGASWHLISGEVADFDLSCVIFRADGVLVDTVYHGCLSNRANSIRHVGDDRTGLGEKADEDETILVYCDKVALDESALLFTISCFQDDDMPGDLMRADYFTLTVYCQGEFNKKQTVVTMDVKNYITYNDHTVVPVVLFRIGNLWTAQIIGKALQKPNWGYAIPELKRQLVGLPPMQEGFPIDEYENIKIVKKYEDRSLDLLANTRHGLAALEDTTERHVTVVRVDLGWQLMDGFASKVSMDMRLIFFDRRGGELMVVDRKRRVADGTRLLDDQERAACDVEGAGAFPVDESIELSLPDFPVDARSVVFLIGNTSGNGLEFVDAVNVRVTDITDRKSTKDIVVFNVDCRDQDAPEQVGVAVCKLYREPKSSAYFQWRSSNTTSIDEFVGSGSIRNTVEFVRSNKSKKDIMEAEGGDVEWRVRAVGLKCRGRTLDDTTLDVQSVAVYDGRRDTKGRRTDNRAKCSYPNGDTFFGEYKNGKRHGMGVYVMANGGLYAGKYFKGLRHGHGLLAAPDGSYYEGDWEADRMMGFGVYSYRDGSKFTGPFQDGKKNGPGQYIYADGSFVTGTWNMGNLEGPTTFDAANHHLECNYKQDALKGPSLHTVAITQRAASLRPRSIPETLKPDLALAVDGNYDWDEEGDVPVAKTRYKGMDYDVVGVPTETDHIEYKPQENVKIDGEAEQDAEGSNAPVAQLY